MSETRNDGGPAFARPASEHTKNGTCPDGNDPRDAQAGMSLRDWFAGQALAGMMAQGFIPNQAGQSSHVQWNYADAAYAMADAMLKAREQ